MSNVHFVVMPHTHWDREWYLPMEVFRRRLVRLIDRLVDIMERDPEFRYFYLDGQTIVLEDYEEIRGRSPLLEGLIRDGRIEVGPWYILPDEFLVSGESLIRNLKTGFKIASGYDVKPAAVGYLPDMFGHTSQVPQILSGFGIKHALVWRGMPPEIHKNQFVWRSSDGSEVLTLFLPLGYGLFFNLPDEPKAFADRIQLFLLALRQNDRSGVYLLPAGTDHWEPEESVPSMIKQLSQIKPDWNIQMGSIIQYFDTIKPRLGEIPEYTGELRSAKRTVIIPGVASARLYLKQKNFQAERLIERYLEPLSAWAMTLGGPNQKEFLDYIWKLLLQNHPHDSICGCSVDQVHDEMETRYGKVIQLADMLMHEAAGFLAEGVNGKGERLCAWNPAPAQRPGIIAGEFQARLPRNPVIIIGPEGEGAEEKEIPLQVLETRKGRDDFFKLTIPAPFANLAMIMLANEELFGYQVQEWKFRKNGDTLELLIDLADIPRKIDTGQMTKDVEDQLRDSGFKNFKVRVNVIPVHRVAALVPEIPGYAISSFNIRPGKKQEPSLTIKAGKDSLENDACSIRIDEEGEISILDKQSGKEFRGPRFIDVGDRGDTYNFDPVPDDVPIEKPESFSSRIISCGPHAATIEFRHDFRLPASLDNRRDGRSKKKVPLRLDTLVTIYAQDTKRIDFITRFKNTACDHRLQVAFDAPFITEEAHVETAFDVVDRPTDPGSPPPPPDPRNVASLILGTEATYSTSPQKTFTALSSDNFGVALFNRGLSEVDTVRLEKETRVALTLVRSVGYLSRGDLKNRPNDAGPPLQTPGAQCLREFTCEYAIMTFSGSIDDASIPAAAHHYAFPSLLFTTGSRPGSKKWREGGIKTGIGLFSIKNPRIEMSAMHVSENNSIDLRLYNTGRREEKAEIIFSDLIKEIIPVDLLGRPLSDIDMSFEDSAAKLSFQPCQIITLRLILKSRT
jgi:alpha-mannosidase